MQYTAEYRHTNMGGRDESWIYTKDGKRLEPDRVIRSRTGNHGEDIYFLPDGVYFIREEHTSNTNKTVITVRQIQIKGNEIVMLKEQVIRDDYAGIDEGYPEWWLK